jgi:hypothetical protein
MCLYNGERLENGNGGWGEMVDGAIQSVACELGDWGSNVLGGWRKI